MQIRWVYDGCVGTPHVRMTMVVMDIFDAVLSAPSDDPVWGLRICEATGHGTGTVYPALDRMLKAGWIEDRWEEPQPRDRPRRRFYTVTSAGRVQYAASRAERAERRSRWALRQPQTGGIA